MPQNSVLVVEDDKTLQDVLRYNLNKEGYKVIIASDGLQGVELARLEKPELVLLDYMMPNVDGLTALKEIRRRYPETYVIMFTGKSDPADRFWASECGAVCAHRACSST